MDGTPATCAQLGLYHFFRDRPPVDLVVSGPNYGRNCTSLFSLSSGTIGGALEAAVCQKRAIALSFAFFSRDHDPDLIADACKHSIKLIEHLSRTWANDVDVYSVNVPLMKIDGERKIMVTYALQNYWTSGSSFAEVEPSHEADPESQEKQIRNDGDANLSDEQNAASRDGKGSGHQHHWFKWAPKFADVQKSVEASEPGNDGWAIRQGYTRYVEPQKLAYKFGYLLSNRND